MKTWKNNTKGDDAIIGIGNELIFKVNPKPYLVDDYLKEIESNKMPKDAFTLPFSYISAIQYQEGKKYLQVFYNKDSDSHFNIENNDRRFEIFNYFKEHMPNAEYSFEIYSFYKSSKKLLIALGIATAIFLWALYLAINIENGVEYEIIGSGNSITGIVLILANLGVLKLCLSFGVLFSIIGWRIYYKFINKSVVHSLVFK